MPVRAFSSSRTLNTTLPLFGVGGERRVSIEPGPRTGTLALMRRGLIGASGSTSTSTRASRLPGSWVASSVCAVSLSRSPPGVPLGALVEAGATTCTDLVAVVAVGEAAAMSSVLRAARTIERLALNMGLTNFR